MISMKRRDFLEQAVVAGAGCAANLMLSRVASGQTAPTTGATRVYLDLRRTFAPLDRNLFGSFLEHLGRAIYGGIYDPGSKLSDANGFRKDVLEEVKHLGVPMIRYPGGNFVSGYHWLDGVGPRKDRARVLDKAWNSIETNQFGTNEFMAWCRAAGGAPLMGLNLGTGTPEQAAALVEYCNVEKGTRWSDLRREHGIANPHNVKHWCLGNEMDGPWQIGHMSATEYGLKAIAETAAVCDYVQGRKHSSKKLWLSFDEWNVWYRTTSGDAVDGKKQEAPHLLEEVYNLEDALLVGGLVNSLLRNSDRIKIACLAQLVNVIAPIATNANGLLRHTIFYPYSWALQFAHGAALNLLVESPAYEVSEMDHVPYVDVAGTYDAESRKISLFVFNRDLSKPREVEIIWEDSSPARALESVTLTGDVALSSKTGLRRPRNWLDSTEQKHVAGDAQQQKRRCYCEGPRKRVRRVRYMTGDNRGDDRRQLTAKV